MTEEKDTRVYGDSQAPTDESDVSEMPSDSHLPEGDDNLSSNPEDAETQETAGDSGTLAEPVPAEDCGVDYDEMARQDIIALKAEFPELLALGDITELDNPLRYAALRDLGLTPREAYLATSKRTVRQDSRSHLSAAAPKSAGSPGCAMSQRELEGARELFGDMSDTDIQKLYRKVTK